MNKEKITLEQNLSKLYSRASSVQDQSNGWLLRHPIKKLSLFKKYLQDNGRKFRHNYLEINKRTVKKTPKKSSGMGIVITNHASSDEDLPLHVVSRNGDKRCLETSLEQGADHTLVDSKGRTPLCVASVHNQPEVAKILVELPGVDNANNDDNGNENDSVLNLGSILDSASTKICDYRSKFLQVMVHHGLNDMEALKDQLNDSESDLKQEVLLGWIKMNIMEARRFIQFLKEAFKDGDKQQARSSI
jgi:hypothetical protein